MRLRKAEAKRHLLWLEAALVEQQELRSAAEGRETHYANKSVTLANQLRECERRLNESYVAIRRYYDDLQEAHDELKRWSAGEFEPIKKRNAGSFQFASTTA